jgi:hypothetical protein
LLGTRHKWRAPRTLTFGNKIMKLIPIILIAVLTATFTLSSYGLTPPPPAPLSARVQRASHIVIGVAKELHVITWKDFVAQRVEPPPAHLGLETTTEIQIDIQEVLFPPNHSFPEGKITYRFGGGFFDVESIRRDTLSKTNIYLIAQYQDQDGPRFGPAYGWNLCESIDTKDEIISLLKKQTDKKLNEAEQAGPGYPPQGVGSPDP